MSLRIQIFALALITLFAGLTLSRSTTVSAAASTITGYAWSDTIGWIDLNCSNTNSCGTNNWGLSVAADGTLSGYAWSDNIGWISANASDLSGCPASPCSAKISGNALTGWLKALSANGNGWDGWISLSGSSPSYGPVLSAGVFSGYAWGSDVVGWIDFSQAKSGYTACTDHYYCSSNDLRHVDASCNDAFVETCSYQCSAGACIAPPPPQFVPTAGTDLTGHLQATPALLPSGLTTKLFWNIENVNSCSVTGTNGDSWSGAAAGCSANTCTSGESGQTTSAIREQTTYTLSCTGLDNSDVQESVQISVIPIFHEL